MRGHMVKLVFIFFFIFTSVSLQAYAKKVILASFSSEKRAQKMMQKLPTLSPTLYALADEYNFEVKLKKTEKYHIIVAEVFTDRKTLIEALKKIRKSFKGAYVRAYTSPLEKTPKPQKKISIKELLEEQDLEFLKEEENKTAAMQTIRLTPLLEEEIKDVEVNITSKSEMEAPTLENMPEVIKQEVVKDLHTQTVVSKKKEKIQETEKKQESAMGKTLSIFLEYFRWSHLLILLMGIGLSVYFFKMKRIYD